ncbi:hypothetical protein [Chitinibacter sp. S2-10]|uniref:hypothetical protein n=1 Tax=Chitinibacter sp. S2-10 TaxID=3373597 RepID=UPI003977C331
MKYFTAQDWALLRPQLLTLLSAIVLAAALLIGCRTYLVLNENRYRQTRQQLAALAQSAQEMDSKAQLFRQYQPLYEQLQGSGVLGDEHRLEWLEALSEFKHRWPQLDYSFAAQRRLLTDEQGLALYASEMQLQWRARDEQDFSYFQRRLAALPGRAVARSCELKRIESEAASPGIAVDCRYDWLTIAAEENGVGQ